MSQLKWTCTSEILSFLSFAEQKLLCTKFMLSHSWAWLEAKYDFWACIIPFRGKSFLHKWNKWTLEVISSDKIEGKIPGSGAPLKTVWSENSEKDVFFQDFLLENQEIWPGWLKVRYNWIAFLKQSLELGAMSAEGGWSLPHPSKTSGYGSILSRICCHLFIKPTNVECNRETANMLN